MANLLGNVLGTGVAGYGLFDQAQRMQDIGEQAVTGSQTIGEQAVAGTEFRPFSVASNTGNVAAQNDGSITTTQSQGQQAITDAAQQGAAGLFGAAAQDPASRQADIYNQIMAGINPGAQRDRLNLEGRLQAQGRGGISSAMYGGSPEQFAMSKAQEEARLGAWGQAQQLGMQEQAQQGSLADMMQQASLRGDAALLNSLTPATQIANLGQTGQIAGQNLNAQAQTTGLEAQIQAERQASDLYGGVFGAGANIAAAAGNSIGSAGDSVSGIMDWLVSDNNGNGSVWY